MASFRAFIGPAKEANLSELINLNLLQYFMFYQTHAWSQRDASFSWANRSAKANTKVLGQTLTSGEGSGKGWMGDGGEAGEV